MKVSDVDTYILRKWLKDHYTFLDTIDNIEFYNIKIGFSDDYMSLISFNAYTITELGPFTIKLQDYMLYLREFKINNLLN